MFLKNKWKKQILGEKVIREKFRAIFSHNNDIFL